MRALGATFGEQARRINRVARRRRSSRRFKFWLDVSAKGSDRGDSAAIATVLWRRTVRRVRGRQRDRDRPWADKRLCNAALIADKQREGAALVVSKSHYSPHTASAASAPARELRGSSLIR